MGEVVRPIYHPDKNVGQTRSNSFEIALPERFRCHRGPGFVSTCFRQLINETFLQHSTVCVCVCVYFATNPLVTACVPFTAILTILDTHNTIYVHTILAEFLKFTQKKERKLLKKYIRLSTASKNHLRSRLIVDVL